MSAINLANIPGQMADTTATQVTVEPGGCTILLTCLMPHVHVEANCKKVGIILDALGRQGFVPLMPKFLDTLLAKPFQEMMQLSASPDTVIKAAESSRLTRDLLTKTYTGKKFDADAMSVTYEHAISSSVLMDGNKAVVRAFNAIGASAVRWTWLLSGPALIAYAAALALYNVSFWLSCAGQREVQFNMYFVYAWTAALLTIPILLVWFACGLRARRVVRRATRSNASRRPSQGPWPLCFAILMLAANVGVMQAGIDAATLGLPHGAAWRRTLLLWPTYTPRPMPQSYIRPSPSPVYVPSHPNHR